MKRIVVNQDDAKKNRRNVVMDVDDFSIRLFLDSSREGDQRTLMRVQAQCYHVGHCYSVLLFITSELLNCSKDAAELIS